MSKPTISGVTDESMNLTDILQKELQDLAEAIIQDDKNVGYQDVVAIYCLNKIAQLQLKIEQLESTQHLPSFLK